MGWLISVENFSLLGGENKQAAIVLSCDDDVLVMMVVLVAGDLRWSNSSCITQIANLNSAPFFPPLCSCLGHSKSYGFLEFEEQDMDKLRQIRDDIDWKEVGSHMLHADFIEPTYQTWERLQSRCLAVTGLPKDFTEIAKLREAFSVVTSPVYCQVRIHPSSWVIRVVSDPHMHAHSPWHAHTYIHTLSVTRICAWTHHWQTATCTHTHTHIHTRVCVHTFTHTHTHT